MPLEEEVGGVSRGAWVLFKAQLELELVTGAMVRGQQHTHTHRHELNGRELIVAATSCFFFYKPVSFTEGGLWLPVLPRGSSISVMGVCGGQRHVPVNFNHIKLSQPLTEGMSALYSRPPSLCCWASLWIMCGSFMRTKDSLKYFFNLQTTWGPKS